MVSDAEVRRGHRGLAGEVAHLITAGMRGEAVPFTAVFEKLVLRQPNSSAIDVDALRTALAKPKIVAVLSTAIGGVVAALVALADPSTIVLAGSWGVDERIVNGVRTAVEATARPITIERSWEHGNAAAIGVRTAAIDQIQTFAAAEARS